MVSGIGRNPRNLELELKATLLEDEGLADIQHVHIALALDAAQGKEVIDALLVELHSEPRKAWNQVGLSRLLLTNIAKELMVKFHFFEHNVELLRRHRHAAAPLCCF